MTQYSPEEEAELTKKSAERGKKIPTGDNTRLGRIESKIDQLQPIVVSEDGNRFNSHLLRGKAGRIIMECATTGEPVFVLRAKDLLSVLAATEYLNLVEKYGLDPEIQEGVHTAIASMKDWQRDHAGLVRLPD